MNLLTAAWQWLAMKAGRLPLPGGGSGYGGVAYSGGQFNFVDYLIAGGRALPIQPSDAGDPLLNPIVCICLGWIGTSWPQARPVVGRVDGAGEFTPDDAVHPLTARLQQPNPSYGGKWLFWALNADFWTRGDAYAQIIPGRGGVAELNYLPARCTRAVPDASGYLDHYGYTPGEKEIEVPPEEVLHFRYGIDPDNPLQGVSPLRSAFRELVTDNAAANYKAGLLNNGGVPPIILSPRASKDGGGNATMTGDEAKTLTEQVTERVRQEPGRLRFISAALDMHQLAFEPGKMGLELLQELPETRIPALFQIPPQVLHLRAGLLRSTYNNVSEARAAAWEDCLIPTQDYFAEEMTNKLLHGKDRKGRAYYPGGEQRVLRYDRSDVPELQEDLNAQLEQARQDYQAGIITLEEARAVGGRQTDESVRGQIERERAARLPAPPAVPGKEPGQKARPFRLLSVKQLAGEAPDLMESVGRFRADLLAREESAVAQMTDAYAVARRAIEERANALVDRMERAQVNGEPITQAWLRREERYQALLDQIDAEARALADRGSPIVADAQRGYMGAATEYAETLAHAALGDAPAGVAVTWNRLPASVLEHLIGFASDGSPLSDLLLEIGADAKQVIMDALASGVAQGKNPREMARAIAGQLDITHNRALAIARTEPMRAGRESARQNYAANADVVEGWTWLSAADERTCAGCWAMHGSTHSLDETLDDHPLGRCTPTPRTKSWAEIVGDDSIPDTRPEIASGETVFAGLTEDQQRSILGPGMYELWSTGQVRFEHLVTQEHDERWGSMRRAATQAEALAQAAA